MVEILLSTYNGKDYLRDQLRSIEEQTYKEWKLLIRDDGSNDNETINILEEFKAKNKDKVELYLEENIGILKSFFKLLSYSKAEYVMFCDQDDIWFKDKIEITLKVLLNKEENNKSILIYTDQKVVDKNLNIVSDSAMNFFRRNNTIQEKKKIIFSPFVTGCTILINKILINKLSSIKTEDLEKLILHDHVISIVASLEGEIFYLDKPSMLYRVHGNNETVSLGILTKLKKIMKLNIYLRNRKKMLLRQIKQGIFLLKLYKGNKELIKELEELNKIIRKGCFLKKIKVILKYKILDYYDLKNKIVILMISFIK